MTKTIRTIKTIGLLLFITVGQITFGQPHNSKDYLVRLADSIKDEYGYRNLSGDTIIPLGKYGICFTDTFKTYAIVVKPHTGFVAIDRQENILYQVFPFDNGPDIASDGLFRIIENSKIGFANSITGKVVINPQFDCAWPFIHGVAKVSTECTDRSDGEHKTWLSNNWYYIDKSGKKVNKSAEDLNDSKKNGL
jgi:hypothetical protein